MKIVRLLGLIIFALPLLFSCSKTNEKGIFDDLIEMETVVLYLSKYKLDSVPPEINKLKAAKNLYISIDSSGWTIYPPLSALGETDFHYKHFKDDESFKVLPTEITELTNLKLLSLVGLNLRNLPNDFDKLTNLDTLNLEMNKLTISDEIEKLKKLRNLKYLGLFGNKVDSVDITELKRVNPNIHIDGDIDVWEIVKEFND